MQFDLSKYNVKADDLVFVLNEAEQIGNDADAQTYDGQSPAAFLNGILLEAVRLGASDIHFEPYADQYRIRLRVDGVMREQVSVPRGFGNLVNIRLKVIAGLDIAEHRGTQSGRFRMLLDGQDGLDFRCSITPTLFGETLVLRMLYLPSEILQLDKLGLESGQVRLIRSAIARQQGMVLVSGPTGSGKTVTLYTLLKQLNDHERNIYTVEDPIEINLPGVNQVNISQRQGITFGNVARTILRQDPDIIMLGEMRDQETIDTAVKASHTGHLVLSTLHANSAPKVVPRLRNLEVDAYNIASTVNLIISQRLLRKIDPACREEVEVPRQRLLAAGFSEEELNGLKLYRATPSNENPTGYKGRIGIFEVLPVTRELAAMIAAGATDAEIDGWAREAGIQDLRCSALNKVREGITDVEELERVLGPVEQFMLSSREEAGLLSSPVGQPDDSAVSEPELEAAV